MKLGPLGLFNPTNCSRTFHLAHWHSRHSLTWSWILAVVRQQVMWPRPYFQLTRRPMPTLAIGVGQFAGIGAYRTNGGWQLWMALLWVALSWKRQQPMWYRDIYLRMRDEQHRGNQIDRHASAGVPDLVPDVMPGVTLH